MNPWMPTLVTALIVFVGVVFNYAILGERVRVTSENLNDLKKDFDKHKDEIWPVVTYQGNSISKIKGHLGMNGDDESYQRGKGHHQ